MNFSNMSFVLLLAIFALLKADTVEACETEGEADETQEEADETQEEVVCEELDKALLRYERCIGNGYTINIARLIFSRVITGESFLAEVNSKCSDKTIQETYTNCTEELLSVCPDLTEVVKESIAEKVSFLCENNQPSSWIRAVLNEDFRLTFECFDRDNSYALVTIEHCRRNAEEVMSDEVNDKTGSLSVMETRSRQRTFIADVFECTFTPYTGDDILRCGSKRKDLLLTYFIFYSSAGGPLRPPIGQVAMRFFRLIMSPSHS